MYGIHVRIYMHIYILSKYIYAVIHIYIYIPWGTGMTMAYVHRPASARIHMHVIKLNKSPYTYIQYYTRGKLASERGPGPLDSRGQRAHIELCATRDHFLESYVFKKIKIK